MATPKHILRIHDTEANLFANLKDKQIAFATDTNRIIWREGADFWTFDAGLKWNGTNFEGNEVSTGVIKVYQFNGTEALQIGDGGGNPNLLTTGTLTLNADQLKLTLANTTGTLDKFLGVTTAGKVVEVDVTGSVTSEQVTAQALAGATYSNVQNMQDIFHSSGLSSGGEIALISGADFSVAGGTGFIRATNDDLSTLYFFDWSALASTTMTANTSKSVGVKYNSGSPIVVVETYGYDWNNQDEFELGVVHYYDSQMHITNRPHKVGDHANLMIERTQQTMPFRRDNVGGGLIISSIGTRNIKMTAGAVWDGLTRWSLGPKDTSVSDTFTTWYYNGTSWVGTTGQTQWSNSQWNNTASGLVSFSSNKWGAHYIYIGIDNDFYLVYSQAEYNTQGQAEESSPPSLLPPNFSEHGVLLGRVVFNEGTNTGIFQSTFTQTFANTVVTDHGSLSGLDDPNDHTWAVNTTTAQTITGTKTFSADQNINGVLNLGSTSNGSPTTGDIWRDSTSGNVTIDGGVKIGATGKTDGIITLEPAINGSPTSTQLWARPNGLRTNGGIGVGADPTAGNFKIASGKIELGSTSNGSPATGDIWRDSTSGAVTIEGKTQINGVNGSPALDIKNNADTSVIQLWSDSDGDGYVAVKNSAGTDKVIIDTDGSLGYVMRVTGTLEVQGDLKVNASNINFSGLPTSSAGLSAGDLWNDSGTLKIV